MAAFDRYSIYPSRFGDMVLRDISDFSFRSASNKSVVIPGGDLHPRAIVNCCSDPMATFTTKDFGTLFGTSPAVSLTSGYGVDTTLGTAATLLQFQSRVDGGSFYGSGTSNHAVATNSKGFLHVTDISASQDDASGAMCSCEYVIMATAASDGVSDPMTWSRTSTLTSSPSYVGIWYLGPVRVGTAGSSSILPGVQSVSIKTGINFRAPRADGNAFPQSGSIHSVVPEIRIRTLDPGHSTLSTILGSPWGNDFASAGATIMCYFQKGVHGGTRVSTASTVHYRVNAVTGDNTTDSISVQQVDDATCEIIIRPTAGLTLSAGVAIT